MTTRTRVMVGLLVAAFLGWLAFGRGPDAPGPPRGRAGADEAERRSRTTRRGAPADGFTATDIPVVITARAQRLEGELFDRERSLFAYARPPEEIEAERKAREAQEAADQRAAAAAQRAADELREQQEAQRARQLEEEAERLRRAAADVIRSPPPPTPPVFRYAYIGVAGPMDDPYAILRSPDQRIVYAKSGDVLDDLFEVQGVWQYRLDVTYVDPRFEGLVAQQPRQIDGDGPPSTSSSPTSTRIR